MAFSGVRSSWLITARKLERLGLELFVGELQLLLTPLELGTRPFRRSPGVQQLILVLLPLAHPHQHAVVLDLSPALPTHRVDEHPDILSRPGAKHQEDLLGAAVEPQKRKPVRLIEDPAADGEDPLDVPPLQVVPLVPEHLEQRGVDGRERSVLRE